MRKGKLHLPRTSEERPFWSKNKNEKPFNGRNLKNISCRGLLVLGRLLLFNFDNDKDDPKGQFSSAHPDAYDATKIKNLLDIINDLIS